MSKRPKQNSKPAWLATVGHFAAWPLPEDVDMMIAVDSRTGLVNAMMGLVDRDGLLPECKLGPIPRGMSRQAIHAMLDGTVADLRRLACSVSATAVESALDATVAWLADRGPRRCSCRSCRTLDAAGTKFELGLAEAVRRGGKREEEEDGDNG